MRIFFSDEKMFDLDGVYNSENDHIWAVNREEANRRDGKKQQRKLAEKVMVRLAVCSECVAPLVLFVKRHSRSSSRKYCLLFYDTETVNLETTGPSNKTTEHHILTRRRKNGVSNIS